MSNTLQPMQLPLNTNHLIEASAGTGKTYTLAQLYLRLVLNHGNENAFGRPLLPDEILVVTFTKAATKELRDRIRTRLVEAADYLSLPHHLHHHDLANDDEALHTLYQSYKDDQQRHSATQQLLLAAESMDEAVISTIHAWCLRVLNEFALYYGGVFESQEIASQFALTQQACEDFWRLHVLPLPEPYLKHFIESIATPASLQKQVTRLLPHLERLPTGEKSLAAVITPVLERLAEIDNALVQLQQQLLDGGLADLEAFFITAEAQGSYNKTSLNKTHKAKALQDIKNYLADPTTTLNLRNKSLKRLALLDKGIWHDSAMAIFTTPLSELITLEEEKQALSAKNNSLIMATHWIAQRLQQVKEQLGLLSMDDQLQHLQQALNSTQGDALAAAIRQRFPVAMVDEFQDTDPIQYDIFNRIYQLDRQATGVPEQPTSFIMIGDPKQAIYSFRGGDIYTYLRARAMVQNNLHTLSHNYRSDAKVIASVNSLFLYGDSKGGKHNQGAFRFASKATAQNTHNTLPFLPVQAGRRQPKQLLLQVTLEEIKSADSKPLKPINTQPAMGAWVMDTEGKSPSKQQWWNSMATHCANTIAQLLNLTSKGLAHLVDYNVVPLQPVPLTLGHMAILVANKKQADTVRYALSQRHIASVYLSDRSNVFSTDIAQELLYVLRAIAEPEHSQSIGVALVTQIIGIPLSRLNDLMQDELLWEETVQQWQIYQQLWQQKSLQACLYQVIFNYATAQRLQANKGMTISGERQLTDLLHLIELLQQASQQVYGQQPLIRHFEALIDESQQPSDSEEQSQQRLESDQNLVQVVTYHKAKGLEYPVVFLPFICDSKPITGQQSAPYVYYDEDHEQQISFVLSDTVKQAMQQAQQAEDVRKLYVALTRAAYCQYIGLVNNTALPTSGIGALFQSSKQAANITSSLQDLSEHITILAKPEDCQFNPALASAHDNLIKPALTMPAIHLDSWRIASYSGLRFNTSLVPSLTADHVDTETLAPESAQQAILAEESLQQIKSHQRDESDQLANSHSSTQASTASPATIPTMHNLPKGALYGTFLHEVLEWCAAQGFAQVLQDTESRQTMWQQKLPSLQLTSWQTALDSWLCEFIQMPWCLNPLFSINPSQHIPNHATPDTTATSFTLIDLKPQQIAVEMEFMFATHHVHVEQLDELVCAHTLGQAPRPQAQSQHIHGLMKGYIDMVVEHQGRYYIIDWKSNFLGNSEDAYHHEAMQQALLAKRYDMQYILYLLALHRLLALRLPDYDYDTHIGGAIYVYLRGYQHPSTHGMIMDKPSRALIEHLDTLFKGQSLQGKATHHDKEGSKESRHD